MVARSATEPAQFQTIGCLLLGTSQAPQSVGSDPISSEDVIRLCDLQQLHQQAFVACYSAEAIKPKHHHRMHLGKAFVSMGVALRCEQHESKHRNYKHGLAERMKSTVHEGFQKSILPRLLLGQAKRMQSIGVDPVRIIGPISQASLFLRELAGITLCNAASACPIFKILSV